MTSVRFQQRLENFEKSFALLQRAIARKELNELERGGLIEDGELWLQALEDRNLTTHTYDEQKSKHVEKIIRTRYFGLLQKLQIRFSRL